MIVLHYYKRSCHCVITLDPALVASIGWLDSKVGAVVQMPVLGTAWRLGAAIPSPRRGASRASARGSLRE